MKKISSLFVKGISILPALLVMPALAETVDVSSASELATKLQAGSEINVIQDISGIGAVTATSKTNFLNLDGNTLSGVEESPAGFIISGGSLTVTSGGTVNGFYRPDTTPSGVNGQEYAVLDARNGAIINLSGGDWTFSNNTVGVGVINSLNAGVSADVNKIVFENNISNSQSASLRHQDSDDTYTSTNITANEIIFRNNTVQNVGDYGNAAYGGGTAVMNSGGTLVLLGNKNTFTGNVMNAPIPEGKGYKRGGGAVLNQSHEMTNGTKIDSTMVIGKSDGSSENTFSNNSVSTNGGAIMNRAVDTDGSAYLTIKGTTTFNDNTAAESGGAIYNIELYETENPEFTHVAQTTFNGATTFTGNKALNGLGGALYNTGTAIFNGDTIFTGNTDSTGANDIYNDGTVNIASGTTTIDGGITGNGVLNIANGATLNIGTASITQGTIDLDGTMLAILRNSNDAQITANTFTGDGVLKLAFDNPGTYKVFGDAEFDNIDISSPIYDLSWKDGTVTTVAKSVESIVASNKGISSDSGKMISALASSNDDTASQMSLAIQESLANGDVEYVEQEVSKMNPEKSPVTTSVALSVQNQVMAAAGERMSLPLTGRSGGDIKADLGVWAKGMYNRSKQKDTFTSHTWGGSVGVDTDLNHSVILGAGYSFGDTNVDLHTHDVDIDSNTLFVYGQYRNSDWFVNGTIAYTMANYDWNKTVFGVNTNPSYKVNSLSEQIMGGYHFDNGITPTVGLRYLDVHQDSYKDGIVTVNDMDSTYLTGVIGMDFKNAWIAPHTSLFWNPELHLAATYDMVSDPDVALVMVPGAAAYTLETDSLSRLGGEFGIGVTAEYYYLTVSLNYDLTIHKDFSSQTGSLKVKYKF